MAPLLNPLLLLRIAQFIGDLSKTHDYLTQSHKSMQINTKLTTNNLNVFASVQIKNGKKKQHEFPQEIISTSLKNGNVYYQSFYTR